MKKVILTWLNTSWIWLNTRWIEAAILVVGAIVMHLPLFAQRYRGSYAIDPQTAGQFGDYIGGYIGTGFTLISVILIYSTLKHQGKFSDRERFESRYFELINLHRQNVAELELIYGKHKRSGRSIFVELIRELRAIRTEVERIAILQNKAFGPSELLGISYTILLYGTGPNSVRMLTYELSHLDGELITVINSMLSAANIKSQYQTQFDIHHYPFDGHQSRLGHYYRHLYQLVCYVDEQPFDFDTRYKYVKTIRAQLSTHEQAMLLVNSMSIVGERWRENGKDTPNDLIEKYRLVKNLPITFFDKGQEIDIEAMFDPDYFEGHKRTNS